MPGHVPAMYVCYRTFASLFYHWRESQCSLSARHLIPNAVRANCQSVMLARSFGKRVFPTVVSCKLEAESTGRQSLHFLVWNREITVSIDRKPAPSFHLLTSWQWRSCLLVCGLWLVISFCCTTALLDFFLVSIPRFFCWMQEIFWLG